MLTFVARDVIAFVARDVIAFDMTFVIAFVFAFVIAFDMTFVIAFDIAFQESIYITSVITYCRMNYDTCDNFSGQRCDRFYSRLSNSFGISFLHTLMDTLMLFSFLKHLAFKFSITLALALAQ